MEKQSLGILNRMRKDFSFIHGNYLVLLLSWVLMDTAEIPSTYYSDYIFLLGGSATILGVIMLISQLTLALVQFPGGYLADKYGRRWLVSTLTFGVASSYIFYAIAPSWHFILIGAVLANLSLLYQPALMAMMADSLPPEKRGIGFSIWNLVGTVATTPAPAIALFLVTNYGPIGGMRIAYTIVTVFFFGAAILRSRLKESMKNTEKLRLGEIVRSYPKAFREGINVWKVVPRSTLYLFFASVIARFGFAMTGLYFLVYAFRVLQIGGGPLPLNPPPDNPILAMAYANWGLVMIVLFITMIISALPSGRLLDKVGRKIPLLLSGLLIIPAVLIFLYGNFLTLFVAMPLMSFAQLLAFSAFQTLFADLVSQENRGKVMGSMNFFSYIFMAIGAITGGILYDFVSPQLPFLLMIAFVVPELLIILRFVHEPKKREQ